jgi:lipopolysaccharide export system protein LptA
MTVLRALGLAAALAFVVSFGAAAQDQATPPSGDGGFDFGGAQPIEISADNGIEWNREARTYTARGNAVVTQGTSELHADTLVASYGASSNQIDHVVAEGAVKIMSPSQTAYGDRADFDQTRRVLLLTGSALKLESANETVTARDTFEYWQEQDAVVAKGDVLIARTDGTRINGDQVTSYFRKNAETGKREVFQVKAEGNVRIDTGKEVVTSKRAVYDPNTQIAVLTGNVELTQNKNVFRGNRAEIDMAKGISRLLPSPGERVRTTIQPKQNSNQGSSVPSAMPAGSATPINATLALDTAAAQ